MKKTLEDKKKELKMLQQEIKEEEFRLQHEKEVAEAKENKLYIPLATATVKYNLYNKGERDFEEIGDSNWYTASQLLGAPNFKKGAKVVLISCNEGDGGIWFAYKEDGDYYGIEENEIGMPDDIDNREYLADVLYVK